MLRFLLPQIVPEGSEAALRQEAEAAAAAAPQQKQQGKGGGGRQQQQQKQQQQQQQGAADQAPSQQSAPPAAAGQQPDATAAGKQTAPPVAAGAAEPEASAAALPPKQRTQIVVPVSSSHPQLTPELLQRLFSVRGVQAQQLLLALVDSNGVVTRRWEPCMHAGMLHVPLLPCRCLCCCRQRRRRVFNPPSACPALAAAQHACLRVCLPGPAPCSCLYNYIQAPLEGPGTANLELLDD